MKFLICGLVLILTVPLDAAGRCVDVGGVSPMATRTVVAVDQSESIRPQQRGLWLAMGKSLVACLPEGGALLLWPIHDRTADAAPDLQLLFPTVCRDCGLSALGDSRQKLLRARRSALAGVEKLFAHPQKPAQETDIFSLFDRVQVSDRQQETRLFLFTDALHSGTDLNIERLALKEDQFPSYVQALAKKHKWTSSTLAGTTVYVLLPSADLGSSASSPNDRLTLRRFYDVLVRSLGGRLAVFETHFN